MSLRASSVAGSEACLEKACRSRRISCSRAGRYCSHNEVRASLVRQNSKKIVKKKMNRSTDLEVNSDTLRQVVLQRKGKIKVVQNFNTVT